MSIRTVLWIQCDIDGCESIVDHMATLVHDGGCMLKTRASLPDGWEMRHYHQCLVLCPKCVVIWDTLEAEIRASRNGRYSESVEARDTLHKMAGAGDDVGQYR